MLVAAPFVAFGLRLIVEGTCPSAAAVTACLTPLLPPTLSVISGPKAAGDPPAEPDLRASVEPLDELLRVQVRDGNGRLLSHNDLPRSATCDGLAAAAAIVILTAVTAQPQAMPPPLAVPPPPRVDRPAPPPPRVTFAVAAMGTLALTTGGGTAGGGLDLQLATPQDTWGGRLLLLPLGWRQTSLEPGAADWLRLPLSLLARRRLRAPPSRVVLDVSAGVWAAAVLVRGSGLAENYRSLNLDLGLGGGLRVGRLIDLPVGQLVPTVELLAVGWLRRQDLRLQDEAGPVFALPAWDILLSVGLGWQKPLP